MGAGLLSVGKWLVTHPFQIATVVLAMMLWHYHGDLVKTRADLALTCKAVDPKKTANCHEDVVNVVASRDSYKLNAATSESNAAAAIAANTSSRAALAEVKAELERTQGTQAAAKLRADNALRELRKARNTIAAASAREATLRANLYANDPVCSAWGASLVCPGVDSLLRKPAPETGPAAANPAAGHADGSPAYTPISLFAPAPGSDAAVGPPLLPRPPAGQ